MSKSEYTRLPEDELDEKHVDSASGEDESEVEDIPEKPRRSRSSSRESQLHRALREDPRFNIPTPSPWTRFALLLFTAWLFWLAFTLRLDLNEKKAAAQVIYASRYSKEFKYRPAASPIITERLKDGRTRVRGAQVTATGGIRY